MPQLYHDLNLFAKETPQGDAFEYYDNEAIKSALLLWLSSKRGEFLKRPTDGGPLDFSLFKQMTDEKKELLSFSIRSALEMDFSPSIQLISLRVNPDYTNRLWQIDVEYTEPLNGTHQELTIYTKDLTQKTSFDFENVDYTEINLLNWVKIKKPDMKGKLLRYNTDRNFWQWGKYLLIKLTASDSYFEDILTICNLT